MDTQTEPPRVAKRRIGVIALSFFAGLILIGGGILFESFDWDKRTLGYILYRINPLYWPLFPIPLLWAAAALFFNNFLKTHLSIVRKHQYRIKGGIVLAVIFWEFWLQWTVYRRFYLWLYYKIYTGYIIGPMSQFLIDGQFTWKLLIMPVFGIIAISWLLYTAHQQRKKNNAQSKH